MHIYKLYKTEGIIEELKSDLPLSLSEMQDIVGGYIEGLSLSDGTYLVFNEEGSLQDLPVNPYWKPSVDVLAGVMTLGGLRGNVIQGRLRGDLFIGLETKPND